jgi:hypothetical protein
MSYLHLTRTRTRERTPDYDAHYTRPLVRRDSKRQRIITLSDDEDDGADDYPYSSSHRPSRALTVRNQPSQLERYNIWSDRRNTKDDDSERQRSYERSRTYKYTSPRHHHHSLSSDDEEREFRLKVQATFARPTSSHHHHESDSHFWPSDLFRRKENWVDENWETRERSTSRERRRRDSFWGEDEEKDEETEKWSRYRKMKRTKTEDVYRPLSGWRRQRIVYGS